MQRSGPQRVGDPPGRSALLDDDAGPDLLVRRLARLCSLLRDANRLSWLAPEVRSQVGALREDLEQTLVARPYPIEFDERGVRAGDARIDNPPRAVRQLSRMFARKGLRGVEFRPGLSAYELVVLGQVLQSRALRAGNSDREQLEHVVLLESAREATEELPQILRPSRLGHAVPEHDGADRNVRELVIEITAAIDSIAHRSEQDVVIDRTPDAGRKSASGLLELVDQLGSNAEIALILSSLRRYDSYTYDHSINVGLLSICLARHLGWKGRDLHEVGIAALIHDVGKLYTPLDVLNKPDRLTPQEWIQMKRHPRDGYEILKEGGVGSPIAPSIALEHHIGYDGAGYPPLNYAVSQVHPGSRIVKIADVYDAFTTIRPYRSQARPREVLKMFRKQAGTNFDPEMVEAFCDMMGEYPIGSTVKLASGRIGLVVDVHPDHEDRPVVRLVQDEKEGRQQRLTLVDLIQQDPTTGQYVDSVVETIDPVNRNIPMGRYV